MGSTVSWWQEEYRLPTLTCKSATTAWSLRACLCFCLSLHGEPEAPRPPTWRLVRCFHKPAELRMCLRRDELSALSRAARKQTACAPLHGCTQAPRGALDAGIRHKQGGGFLPPRRAKGEQDASSWITDAIKEQLMFCCLFSKSPPLTTLNK